MSSLPNLQSDNIVIEFRAFGQIGQFEPFQAYSEFNLLKVEANYLSNSTNIEPQDFTVYPNPFDSSVMISTLNNQSIEYQLINAQGKLVKQGAGNRINAGPLHPGFYTIIIHTKEKTINKRLIKH